MPNKIVQLVDNENNNIYPVAGSLAQDSVTTSTINDGAVTTAKLANEAVTSEKVDFSSFVYGVATIGAIPAASGKQVTVNIPEQANTNYTVLVSGTGGGGAYSFVTFTVLNKTTTSFKIEGWNNYNDSTGDISASYLLLP